MTDNQSAPINATDAAATADSTAQTDVGALLRAAREKVGLDLADAARALRISLKYLQALEDSRYADLPGAAYAIGFVRSYAEYLHLDGEEIVRRYKAEAAGVGGKSTLVFPKPIPDGGVPGGAVLGIGVLVAVVAYAGWYWNFNKDDVEIVRVETVPEYMSGQTEAPEPQTAPDVTMNSGEVAEVASVSPAAPVADGAVEEAVADSVAATQEPVSEAVEIVADVVKPTEPTEPATPVEAIVAAEQETADAVENMPQTLPTPKIENQTEDQTQIQAEIQDEAETVAPAIEQAAEPAVESAVEQVLTEPVAAPLTEAVPDVSPETAPEVVSEVATQEVAEAPAPAMETVAPTERQNDGPSRITVRAKSNSWIQVRDEIADRLLFTRLLREGDEYEVPDRDGLRLMTGNAGALELLVDGDAVPSIGAVGEVRRDVELNVDKLKSGSAVTQ